jgi:tetratricopeptide (TPR) repeat protein
MKFAIAIGLSTIPALFISLPGWALSAVEVGKIAKMVTVTIDSPNSPGSGVMIEKSGSSYLVLTAAHVVKNRAQKFKIITPDGEEYAIANINSLKDTDLAVVKFDSKNKYQLATLGDSTRSSEGSIVYVSGFPVATRAISASIYNFTEGKVTANASRPLKDGYSLVYSNNTLPGMSGGPVFNDAGELIAVHGRGDVDESSQESDINSNIRVKTGFNLGIPTTIIAKLASNLGLSLANNSTLKQGVETANIQPKADDYFLSGVEQFNRNNWAGAIAMMDRAIATNPKYIRAYMARAVANYMSNRIGAGIGDVDRAIEIDPKSAIAYVGKCFMTNAFGNRGRALGYCDRAIELNPQLSIAYNTRGVVKIALKNYGGATGDLLRAIQLDPKSYYAYGNLGAIAYLQNNQLPALQYTRQALSLYPQSIGTRVQLGQILVAKKDYQQAIAELNRAIAIYPRLGIAYKTRGLAYIGLGNQARGEMDIRNGEALFRSSPSSGLLEDLSFLNQ